MWVRGEGVYGDVVRMRLIGGHAMRAGRERV